MHNSVFHFIANRRLEVGGQLLVFFFGNWVVACVLCWQALIVHGYQIRNLDSIG